MNCARLRCIIMDYGGFLTIAARYDCCCYGGFLTIADGAGMAHTATTIVHVLSWSYCGLLRITMDYRLSWTIMDYHGLSSIFVDYN